MIIMGLTLTLSLTWVWVDSEFDMEWMEIMVMIIRPHIDDSPADSAWARSLSLHLVIYI